MIAANLPGQDLMVCRKYTDLKAVLHPAILFPATHGYTVDWAGMVVTIPIIRVAIAIMRRFVVMAIVGRPEDHTVTGYASSLEQVGNGSLGFLQQFFAGIGTKRNLADEALGRVVLRIP